MATGFIGSVEIDDDFSVGDRVNQSGSSPTISYTAPSSISYAVVSISESASVALRPASESNGAPPETLGSGCILKGFGVTVSANSGTISSSSGPATGSNHNSTSNESRVVLAPDETISLSASYDGPFVGNSTYVDGSVGYVGAMSVLEVD